MRIKHAKMEDSTFELNLAPMLDIIVSIVPMLLLSVAFVHITVVDTPVPQVVEKAIAAANEKNKDLIQIQLAVSKSSGFVFHVVDHGAERDVHVGMKGSAFDLDGLRREAMSLKKQYPDVFRLELNPEQDVPLNEIVGIMDQLRKTTADEPKVVFRDVQSGQAIETNLVFPDVIFGNVVGS
jgi:biopolymer transport protein ExbD